MTLDFQFSGRIKIFMDRFTVAMISLCVVLVLCFTLVKAVLIRREQQQTHAVHTTNPIDRQGQQKGNKP